MRVLMLNYEFPPVGGGAANANLHLLKEFSDDIHIDLITSSPDKYREEQFSKNIRIYKLDVKKKKMHHWTFLELMRWTYKAIGLTRKLMSYEYDLMHCWFGWPCGYIGYLNRKKLPYIVALRGSDVPGYNKRLRMLDNIVFRRLSRKIWGNASAVIANSQGLKELALETWNGDIEVIPNGVDVKKFRPAKKKNSKLTLVSVGRLIKRKGYGYLIKAVGGLDVKLVLVGEGPEKERLERLASKVGADVEFKGRVNHDDLPEVLRDSDVFVLPSLNEGMSNAILEAMASGLPIITTDTGGSKELIDGNGIIVKKRSSESIQKAVRDLDAERKRFGERSRKIAEDFSWGKVADRYQKLYSSL